MSVPVVQPPSDVRLTVRIDLQCARCQHVGAFVSITLPLLGMTSPDQRNYSVASDAPPLMPVVDVRGEKADAQSECEGCHQFVRWRNAALTNNFTAAGRIVAPGIPGPGHEIGEDTGDL